MKNLVAPDRTFDRGRRCANCRSFENDAMAKRYWQTRRAEDERILQATPALPHVGETQGDARVKVFSTMTRLVSEGVVGLCMKGSRPKDLGGPEGDFVHCDFLCDRWDGRDGHTLATAGHPLDKLNDELVDIADSKAKKS